MPLSKARNRDRMRLVRLHVKIVQPERQVELRYCHACDESRVVDRHHIDRDRLNNSEWNVIDLCPTCHALIHRLNMTVDDLIKSVVQPKAHNLPELYRQLDSRILDDDGNVMPDYD